jgi:hypothetical protein
LNEKFDLVAAKCWPILFWDDLHRTIQQTDFTKQLPPRPSEMIATRTRLFIKKDCYLRIVFFRESLDVNSAAFFFWNACARFEGISKYCPIVSRPCNRPYAVCRVCLSQIAAFDQEEQGVAKSVRIGREFSIVIECASYESQPSLLYAMLVGME